MTRLAEQLVSLGVEPGDRVAIFLPMSPEVAVASHAIAHIGAIQVPIFSGFAAPAVAQRLAGERGEGRDHAARVVAPRQARCRCSRSSRRRCASRRASSTSCSRRSTLDAQPGELPPLEVDSEHPYLLTYTSGTTGKPKGVVHVQGGFLVSIAREVAYQADVHEGDVVHFATDMGWIMGPWTVVGVGALGGTIVFAEGAPDWPTPDRLWRTVEQERVTALGLSPTLARALLPHGDPTQRPLVAAHVRHDRRAVEPRAVPLALRERRRLARADHQLHGRHRGRRVLPLADAGRRRSRRARSAARRSGWRWTSSTTTARSLVGTGEVGELVCRKPFPGMTRGFWRDPDKFIETYWSRIPGVWVHGDWASVDADGYWFLHGRSDDTLNIAGKRIGPAELESAAVGHPAVREAAAIGVPHEVKGETAWIFCCLLPGAEATEAEVAAHVAAELGKAFKPDRVFFVDALPKTRSAKIVRRAVKATALGADPGDLSSLENPESLDAIEAAVA